MATLDLRQRNLLLGANDNILLYNLNDDSCLSYKVPTTITDSQKTETATVTVVTLSENCTKFAVVTTKKELLLYVRQDNVYELTCTHTLQRAASAMSFSKCSDKLIIADKSGDVFISENKSSWVPILVLGHLSMLLDVLITPDEKCIISCDRDEKIRISSYPDTYNIIAYCLGHEEFVSALDLLPKHPDILFSASGDATMRAWYYMTGQQLLHVKLNKPATSMKLTYINEDIHAIVSYHKSTQVDIYDIFFNENKSLHCKILQSIDLSANPVAYTIFGHNLWFSSNETLIEYAYNDVDRKYINSERTLCKSVLDLVASTKCFQIDDFISSLFKKQYNNVEEYHKKKMMRMSKDCSLKAK